MQTTSFRIDLSSPVPPVFQQLRRGISLSPSEDSEARAQTSVSPRSPGSPGRRLPIFEHITNKAASPEGQKSSVENAASGAYSSLIVIATEYTSRPNNGNKLQKIIARFARLSRPEKANFTSSKVGKAFLQIMDKRYPGNIFRKS